MLKQNKKKTKKKLAKIESSIRKFAMVDVESICIDSNKKKKSSSLLKFAEIFPSEGSLNLKGCPIPNLKRKINLPVTIRVVAMYFVWNCLVYYLKTCFKRLSFSIACFHLLSSKDSHIYLSLYISLSLYIYLSISEDSHHNRREALTENSVHLDYSEGNGIQ